MVDKTQKDRRDEATTTRKETKAYSGKKKAENKANNGAAKTKARMEGRPVHGIGFWRGKSRRRK